MFNFGGAASFERSYSVSPMAAFKPEYSDGGKIFLPASALASIATRDLEYPLMFCLSNPSLPNKVTHAGVQEFTAPEGRCLVPYWMMQNIGLNPDNRITITYRSLPRATFVKLQPQSVDFLDISNPRAVLEKKLRGFSAMTKGDMFLVNYNNKEYYLQVLEIKPENPLNAISIVNADVNVDFAPPVGYVPPEKPQVPFQLPKVNKDDLDPTQHHSEEDSSSEEEDQKFSAFSGSGARISGKEVGTNSALSRANEKSSEEKKTFINKNGQMVTQSLEEIRKLRAARHAESQTKVGNAEEEINEDNQFKAFSGKGYRMR